MYIFLFFIVNSVNICFDNFCNQFISPEFWFYEKHSYQRFHTNVKALYSLSPLWIIFSNEMTKQEAVYEYPPVTVLNFSFMLGDEHVSDDLS